jgi:ATP diphosphatase
LDKQAGIADMADLLAIMARLRDRETGCPWDVEQDFASIAAYTIEEAYEVADAIDRNDLDHLKDELGDLLLQVVFHAQMASEQGAFDFGGVVAAICDKMTRRHPHVFAAQGCANAAGGRMPEVAADASVEDAETQTREWEAQKRREREAAGDADASALAGISRGMPEWQRAVKLQSRAARVGFDWPDIDPVIAKLHEEIEEVRVEFARGDVEANRERLQDEIGDVLFVCANLARHAKVDVGAALRHANLKFERRFRSMESLAAGEGTSLAQLPLEQQEAYWDRAKRIERGQE